MFKCFSLTERPLWGAVQHEEAPGRSVGQQGSFSSSPRRLSASSARFVSNRFTFAFRTNSSRSWSVSSWSWISWERGPGAPIRGRWRSDIRADEEQLRLKSCVIIPTCLWLAAALCRAVPWSWGTHTDAGRCQPAPPLTWTPLGTPPPWLWGGGETGLAGARPARTRARYTSKKCFKHPRNVKKICSIHPLKAEFIWLKFASISDKRLNFWQIFLQNFFWRMRKIRNTRLLWTLF